MPRTRSAAPATRPTRRRAAPVVVRHVFEDLAPALRATALEMTGGDRSRVQVLAPGKMLVDVTPRS